MSRKNRLIAITLILIISSIACQNNLGEKVEEVVEQVAKDAIGQAFEEIGMPVPDAVDTINLTNGIVSFESETALIPLIVFFRLAAESEGYTERSELTIITETTAHLVFDGHSSGKPIIVDMVDMGDGSTNVSMRRGDL